LGHAPRVSQVIEVRRDGPLTFAWPSQLQATHRADHDWRITASRQKNFRSQRQTSSRDFPDWNARFLQRLGASQQHFQHVVSKGGVSRIARTPYPVAERRRTFNFERDNLRRQAVKVRTGLSVKSGHRHAGMPERECLVVIRPKEEAISRIEIGETALRILQDHKAASKDSGPQCFDSGKALPMKDGDSRLAGVAEVEKGDVTQQ
jgi:hypothetical protein